jgi:hypothetical protein
VEVFTGHLLIGRLARIWPLSAAWRYCAEDGECLWQSFTTAAGKKARKTRNLVAAKSDLNGNFHFELPGDP